MQLEDEQTYLVTTLNKQLREVNGKKEALKRKLDAEKREKNMLLENIEKEQKFMKDHLEKKL